MNGIVEHPAYDVCAIDGLAVLSYVDTIYSCCQTYMSLSGDTGYSQPSSGVD